MKNIICAILGHKSITGLYENDSLITNGHCARCKAVNFPFTPKRLSIPTPGTPLEDWKVFRRDWLRRKREKIINQIIKQK